MEKARTKYYIHMKNPERAKKLKDRGRSKSRNSTHKVKRLNESTDTYEDLPALEEIWYRALRMRFNDELSFDVYRFGSAKLIFTIGNRSDWTFADEPFEILEGDRHVVNMMRVSDKKATIRINGGEDEEDFVKYAINFKDAAGQKQVHDPIVRNGQGIPLIPAFTKFGDRDLALENVFGDNLPFTERSFLESYVKNLEMLLDEWDDRELNQEN